MDSTATSAHAGMARARRFRSRIEATGFDDARGSRGHVSLPVVARIVAFGLPITVPGLFTLTAGPLLAALLWPILTSRSRPGPRLLTPVGLAVYGCVASGGVLALLSGAPAAFRRVDQWNALGQAIVLVSFGLIVIAAFWCVEATGVRWTLAMFALGFAVNVGRVRVGQVENLWKYGLGLAVVVIVLVGIPRARIGLQVIACLVLAAFSALNDTRNITGVLVLAAAATAVSPFMQNRRASAMKFIVSVVGFASVAYGAFTAISWAIARGWFGEAIATRQEIQQRAFGALGGRTEYGAFFSMFLHKPMGYGLGVFPSMNDIEVGKEGLDRYARGAGGAYVDDYLFGGNIELHSIAADLWVQCGLVGLAVAVVAGLVIVAAMADFSASSVDVGPAVLVYVAGQALWDLAFSPLIANYSSFALAVAIALFLRRGRALAGPSPVT
ncbi:hypothetical protein OG579_08435 [Williamsia herbipolensis]|uniref:O-antigen polysaccharide polymerase Wzy n=1 Tax=Williamsia herbipolensis TaxID=1603258 RepID=A0AAU4K6Q0_9NOCA|nr:hypothetical protein [Williamsia herbipolensis]